MEEDFAKNILAATLREGGNNDNSDSDSAPGGSSAIEVRDSAPGELNNVLDLKQNPSPGDHRRVIVIHRLRFPRLLKRRFRKV